MTAFARKMAGRALGLLMGLAVGCTVPPASRSGRAGRAPSAATRAEDLSGISLVELEIEPRGAWAERYGVAVPHTLSRTEAAIGRVLDQLSLHHSPALSRVTREIARTAPDRVNVPPALVDGLMAWGGLIDPPPRLVIVELPEDRDGCHTRPAPSCARAIDSLVAQVEAAQLAEDAQIDYGVGVVALRDGATRLMVAVLEKTVVVEPLGVAVGARDSFAVRGRLLGSRRNPSLEVIDPQGRWKSTRVPLSAQGTFGATTSCQGVRGPHQVEVLVEGTHGPEVAANFPVYCGVRPPSTMTVTMERLDPDVTPAQIARANFHYLNEERERRGLPALQWDDRAAAVAEEHSLDMAKNGFVGHRSPTTGDVRDRFTRARIRGSVIRENVARGYGPKGIHDSLMRSPGHRVNIVAHDVTHVGIGVVIGAPESNVPGAPRPIFATQNYYRAPGAGAPKDADLLSSLRDKIDAQRKAAKLRPANWDPKLDQIATRVAKAYARGRTPRPFDKDVFALGYKAVETHRVESPDFFALATVETWQTPQLVAGIGIERVGEGESTRFLMVVLVAEPG